MSFARLSIAASALLLMPSLADPIFYMYPDDSCSRAGYFSSITPSVAGKCKETYFDDNTFNKTGADQYTVWVQFEGVEDGCEGLIYDRNNIDPSSDNCGSIIAASNLGKCVEFDLPTPVGLSYCCGTDCTDIGAPPARVKAKAKREALKQHARDISPVQQQKRDDCRWNPSDHPFRQGVQVTAKAQLNCEEMTDCSEMFTWTEQTTTTNTFGVDVQAEAGFFDIVSVTAGFSYQYSTSDSNSYTVSTTVGVPAGKNGRIDFVPRIECSTGSFSGDCDAAFPPSGQSGDVCIPYLVGGHPDGEYQFVQQF